MLENVIAATGGLPQETGDLHKDYKELKMFLLRLMRVIERNDEKIMQMMQQKNGGI